VEEDQYQYLNDGTMREEFVEDVPFVGHRCDCPLPSFYVGHDITTRKIHVCFSIDFTWLC